MASIIKENSPIEKQNIKISAATALEAAAAAAAEGGGGGGGKIDNKNKANSRVQTKKSKSSFKSPFKPPSKKVDISEALPNETEVKKNTFL